MPYRNSPDHHTKITQYQKILVLLGGIFLAATAGYINVVVLGYFHTPVSHMSGAVSRLSIDLAENNFTDFKIILTIVAGFFIGAVISGIIIGKSLLKPGRRYGIVLMIEGVILSVAAYMFMRRSDIGMPLAAMACGMQNAMASSFYGLIIRTTHVTGIVTDIGVLVGHWIKNRKLKPYKIILLSGLLIGFLAGGFIGAIGFSSLGTRALFPASLGCVIFGFLYYVWRQTKMNKESKKSQNFLE